MKDLFKLYNYTCSACEKGLIGRLKRQCYACERGLVGALKTNDLHNVWLNDIQIEDEYWECRCIYHTCTCEKDNESFFCPICNDYFQGSKFLFEIFGENKKSLWIANMVTHYRHTHITSWNKRWNGTYKDSNFHPNFDYDIEKTKINERAKRQIVSKCKDFILYHEFSINDLLLLQNNEQKTVDKWNKLLS